MSKVRDNSAPKMIFVACWGARAIARHSSPSLLNPLNRRSVDREG